MLRKTYLLLPAVILAGLLALVLITRTYTRNYEASAALVRHTIVVIGETQASLSCLHDLEKGLPADSLARHIAAIGRLTVDNRLQQDRVDSLLLYLAGLQLHPILHPVMTSQYYPDSIREVLLRMQSEEGRLLVLREELNNAGSASLKNAIWALLGGITLFLCVSALVIFYHFIMRRKAEKELTDFEQRFSLLVRHVKDYAIFMLDSRGKVISWNQGAQQIKGFSEEEVLGQHISIFYTAEDLHNNVPFNNLKMAEKLGAYECIGQRRRKDGSCFIADVVFTAMFDSKKQLSGFIKITKDVTDQKKAEEEMQLALSRERDLNEMKSRFVALASHEFKTPLSVILSSTSLLEKYNGPDLEDKRHRHIQRIKSNVKNLSQILGDFLSLEKLEEGIIMNNPAPTDVLALTEEVMLDMEEFSRKGQLISFNTTGEPRLLFIDGHLLRNVLNNLLSNAIKYSPEHEVILFSCGFESGSCCFTVTDHGIGIPAEEQVHLFERFYRARNASGIPGTGLGLSIVRKYLELMDGVIEFSSSPDLGTVFSVRFTG